MNLFNLSTGNFCKTIFHSFSNGVLTWHWISVMVRNLFWFWMIEHIILQTSLHSIKLWLSNSSLICSIRWGNLRHISSMMYVIKQLGYVVEIFITKLQMNFELSRKRKSSCKNINTAVWPEHDARIFQIMPKWDSPMAQSCNICYIIFGQAGALSKSARILSYSVTEVPTVWRCCLSSAQ